MTDERLARGVPAMPTFETVDEERQHRKVRLAATLRVFAEFGFDEGVAGHVTVRDPEFTDSFWVNPFGLHFGEMRVSDLIRVDEHGKVVDGDWPVNAAAFAIHSQIHAARPDVIAAAHTHSPNGRALSSLGEPLRPISQDACAFYQDHGMYETYRGVVLDEEEGKAIAYALGDHKACILRNHGLLTVGRTVEEAAWWFIAMERSCEVQLKAQAAGTPIEIHHDEALQTHGQVGSDLAGWFSFQPMLNRMIRREPELLD